MSTEKELMKLPPRELRKLAEGIGVKVAKRDRTRKQLVAKILKHEATQTAKNILDKKTTPIEADESQNLPEQPGFVELCSDQVEPQNQGVTDSEPIDGRGGVRPGAGRPSGMTDEKARVRRILDNQVPDPNIVFVVKAVFGLWSKKSGIKEIALTQDEAEVLAVPTSNLMDYYVPSFELSPALQIWFGLAVACQTVIGPRIEIIKSRREDEQRKVSKDNSRQEGIGEDGQGQQPVGESKSSAVS